MRVLLVKLSSLGDVIHTLPALGDAAAALPGIRFDWVVEEGFREVPAWHPAVAEVIPVALRRWRGRMGRNFSRREWTAARAAIAAHDYDAVIDAQGLLKSAIITHLVKAPRYGMDRHSARESLAALAYDRPLAVPRDMHAVERIRLLFSRALGYTLPDGPGDYGLLGRLPVALEPRPAGLLLLHGSAREDKLWPRQRWVELAALAAGQGLDVWLPWGNEQERERAGQIAASASNAKVLSRMDLLGLAGLLQQARAVVAVDTGLGHLSAALAVPTVSLYGPTDTRLIGTYGANQIHIRPAGAARGKDPRPVMAAIPAPRVWEALQTLPGGLA
jgi:heptosyltransferase-1